MQLFAWQSEMRGNDVHANSNPTQAALVYKDYLTKKEKLKDTSKTSILDKYGGEEHLQQLPAELRSGQTENYVEYSRTGKLIKGEEKAKARSKYDEDIYPGNHTSVWGSWFKLSTLQWGYACCHSYIKQAYCAGEAGIQSDLDQTAGKGMLTAPPAPAATQTLADSYNSKSAAERKKELEEFEAKQKANGKRKKDGGEIGEPVTEEDMDKYHRKKSRGHFEDPLADVNKDELLPL